MLKQFLSYFVVSLVFFGFLVVFDFLPKNDQELRVVESVSITNAGQIWFRIGNEEIRILPTEKNRNINLFRVSFGNNRLEHKLVGDNEYKEMSFASEIDFNFVIGAIKKHGEKIGRGGDLLNKEVYLY